MTLPVLGSTVTVVPFAWTEYVKFVDVLLDANIWKVNVCPWVTFSVNGPDSVGGTVSANNDRKKHKRSDRTNATNANTRKLNWREETSIELHSAM